MGRNQMTKKEMQEKGLKTNKNKKKKKKKKKKKNKKERVWEVRMRDEGKALVK